MSKKPNSPLGGIWKYITGGERFTLPIILFSTGLLFMMKPVVLLKIGGALCWVYAGVMLVNSREK